MPVIGGPQRCQRVYNLADDDAVHMGRPITTTATSVTAATHIALLLLLVPLLLR